MFRMFMMGAAIVATFLALTANATTSTELPAFIVILHDRPVAGGAEAGEPDIRALGGEVLQQWRNRRVIRLSESAVRELMKHRGVQSIQRVQTDSDVADVPRLHPKPRVSADVIATEWAAPTWASGDYEYDGAGNITAIGTTANPASDGGTESFVYDSADRLVDAVVTRDSTTHFEKYSYDSFGNLTYTQRNAGPSTTTTASLATNRLTMPGVAYDAVGNVVASEGAATEYIYDAFNMMRRKSTSLQTAYYLYTADDERIGVDENSEQRWMVRDLSGRVLREWEGTSLWDASTWVWREDYIYRGSALAAAETADGMTRHFHLDHLGTPRLITDENRLLVSLHDYFPFGVEKTNFRQEMDDRGTDRPEPMKFTGHERDFSGGTSADNRNQLDYMHARYYSPVWGRFLSVDPTWESADLGAPQTWNRYTYARNSPLRYTDPDGRIAIADDIVIGAFVGTMLLATYAAAPSAVPGKSNGEVMVDTAIDGFQAVGRLFDPASGGSSGEMAAETMINNYQRQQQAKLDQSPIQSSSEGGGGRTDRKLDKHTRAHGQDKVDKLRGDLKQLQSTPNKTPEVKEQIKTKERELKRAQDQQRKSEEHARTKQR